jgi:MFS family permease
VSELSGPEDPNPYVSPQAETSPPGPAPLPRNVWLLGAASLFNDTASEIIFSLTPAFLKTIGGTPQHLGLIEGLADTVAALLKLQAGRWSDRMQARNAFVIFGYAVAALIRPFAGLAQLPWHLVSIRLVDRIGKGLRTAPRDALLAESVPVSSRGRAFGLHRAMDHLGAALGPLSATVFLYCYPGATRTLFGLTLLPGLLVLVAVFMVREERDASQAVNDGAANNLMTPLPGRFRWFLAAMTVFALGNSSDAFLLNRCLDVGVEELWLPTIWFAFHIAKSAGNIVIGRLVDRVGPRWPLLVGWALYAAVYLGFAAAVQAWQAVTLFMVYAVFYALTEPAEKTIVTQLVPAEQKGRAFGWFHLCIGLAALPANLMFGTLYVVHPFLAFGLGALLAGLACVLSMIAGTRTAAQLGPGDATSGQGQHAQL